MTLALYLAAYAVISAAGLVLLKRGMPLVAADGLAAAGAWIGAGAVLYGGGFVMWMALLRTHPLTVVFPMAAGALFLATAVLGAAFLGERVTHTRAIGMAVIVIGVALVARGSTAPGSDPT